MIKNSRLFFVLYGVFVLVLTVLLVLNSKADLHLWMTSRHNDWSDLFFKYYTEVGGWIPFLVAAGLLFYRYRAALLVLVAQLITGGVTQIGKFAWNEPRPKRYFLTHYPDTELHRVSDVYLYSTYSFPSGHTTAAFSLFLALTLLTPRKALHLVFFLMAALVGYSRIYLSQHFAIDVLVGSLVGVAFTLPCKFYLDKWVGKWGDGSLCDLFVRK